jgi:hypothetical protein
VRSARCRDTGDLVALRRFDPASVDLLSVLEARLAGLPHSAALRGIALSADVREVYVVVDFHPCDSSSFAEAQIAEPPFAYG